MDTQQSSKKPVALITGGARRLGALFARHLARQGWRIVIHYGQSREAAEKLAAELNNAMGLTSADVASNPGQETSTASMSRDSGLRALPIRALALQADLSQPGAGSRLVEQTWTAMGQLDAIIHSASEYDRQPLLESTPTELARSLQLHGLAAFEMAQAWQRLLASKKTEGAGGARSTELADGNKVTDGSGQSDLAQPPKTPQAPQVPLPGPCFIGILDARAQEPMIQNGAYGPGKKLLGALLQDLAHALAPQIRVGALAPGLVLPPDDRPAAYQDLKDSNPLEDLGQPEDLLPALDYLLQARFTTGQVLWVDGGRHLGRLAPAVANTSASVQSGPATVPQTLSPGAAVSLGAPAHQPAFPSLEQSPTLSEISIQNLEIQTIIGILPREQVRRQPLVFTLKLRGPFHRAAGGDLGQSLDYKSLHDNFIAWVRASSYGLLEELAEAAAAWILEQGPVEELELTMEKPRALPGSACPAYRIVRRRSPATTNPPPPRSQPSKETP